MAGPELFVITELLNSRCSHIRCFRLSAKVWWNRLQSNVITYIIFECKINQKLWLQFLKTILQLIQLFFGDALSVQTLQIVAKCHQMSLNVNKCQQTSPMPRGFNSSVHFDRCVCKTLTLNNDHLFTSATIWDLKGVFVHRCERIQYCQSFLVELKS